MELLTSGQVLARFGHALSDPTRSRRLLALREAPGYPAELAELLEVSRQSLSNHLACLRGCGLVVAVPEGRRTRYELADAQLAHALSDLLGVVLGGRSEYVPDGSQRLLLRPRYARLHHRSRTGRASWSDEYDCWWPRPSRTTSARPRPRGSPGSQRPLQP